ncbi:flagellar protein FlaG [Pseudoalteromonas issachenkonii]|jgi:flagellar protein FlaG|uniref:Flagellar biosynthesis protein FlaG n=2 Tax=Pseudoalteromonas TaxID=53246 RepID=A0ABD4EU87_9GAMM|nr:MULTISPECIES: flagellar protein FlaG [Pseudoalteromonas]MAY59407.1 flagellar biosynthesis protein FlaG [Pseudoalteromonas sp.]ALQ55499.1 flagellar protein FlaG [Pseudoalteromonas issachenkonii]ATC91352.1 flagellar protein FlaG [Pseudoalteromonas issachenkonii]KYL37097.1 flagellar biosynthesis protein FlaG [Pseudoalteromonas spiralis]MDN3395778.1 flagellar protein FlaG [Pseudoalteromonas sp. APC 3215]|tara:strand:+ start:402 stop:788 length:387 start_codon:yes stop_codon:yes gene_type:complete
METQNLNLNISSAQKGEVTSSYQAPSQVKQNIDEQKNTTTPTAASNNEVSKTELSPEKLEKVVQQLQDFMGEMNRSLQFKVDEDSGRNVIKVIDKESGDLVKQYPSEEVLGIVAKLAEATGVLVDFKV